MPRDGITGMECSFNTVDIAKLPSVEERLFHGMTTEGPASLILGRIEIVPINPSETVWSTLLPHPTELWFVQFLEQAIALGKHIRCSLLIWGRSHPVPYPSYPIMCTSLVNSFNKLNIMMRLSDSFHGLFAQEICSTISLTGLSIWSVSKSLFCFCN